MIVITSTYPTTPTQQKRLRKNTREMMQRTGRLGLSTSGTTLGYAVEWCEEKKKSYVIQAVPGVGYSLQVTEML